MVANNADALQARVSGATILGNFTRQAVERRRADRAARRRRQSGRRGPLLRRRPLARSTPTAAARAWNCAIPEPTTPRPEAWAASDETANADVADLHLPRHGRLRRRAVPTACGRSSILGLLDAGEVLLDDVQRRRDPDGAAVELIQNGDVRARAATVVAAPRQPQPQRASIVDPDNPGNHVLRLVATGPTEHMHNHVETTLAGGRTIVTGQTNTRSRSGRSGSTARTR